MTTDERLTDIEIMLANQQKMLDDLSDVIFAQGKTIDQLKKQLEYLQNIIKEETVKPLSEETPPPHY